jgi:PAS domain S-box-containing protein/putative nucleotidyltransferase with HDIG domain
MIRGLGVAAIILPGWLLLAVYLWYDLDVYGPGFWAHMLSVESFPQTLYHLLVLGAPVASTVLGLMFRERARLHRNLQALEARYRDYYDNAPYGYHSADSSLTLVDVNRAWLVMLGYSREEVVGRMKVTDVLAPASRARVERVYVDFQSTGRLGEMETEMVRKDGTTLPVVLSATAMRGPDGAFMRSRTIVRDNSVKRIYEQTLREMVSQWEDTFSAMPWGVLVTDTSGNVLMANDYVASHPVLDLGRLGREHCTALIGRMREPGARNGNGNGGATAEFEEKGGAFRLSGHAMESDGGRYVFACVDMTEARQGERRLRDSRSAFFNMLKDVTEAYRSLDTMHRSMIFAFANAIDAKSPWTKGHSERVTRYAEALGRRMGLGPKEMDLLQTAALLHDIGKIGTYDYVLDKPDTLTVAEYEQIKEHPARSASILGPIAQFGQIIDVVRHHHEHFDGSGYPAGLEGDAIPYLARILCIADSYDSMTADRPYRPAPGKEYAIEELRQCMGTHFDPALTGAFIQLLEEGRI